MLELAYHENEGLYPDPDPAMTAEWVTSTIINGFVIVAEKAGRIIGSVALTNYQFPWSPRWYLSMDWAYITRGFRGDGAFDALVKAASAFADERGAPIYAGVSSGKDSYMKDRLFQMKGYTYLGGQFLREPQGA
jgi:hypothetical protein